MKRCKTVLIIIGLLLASLSFITTVSAVPGIDKRWAIIMCGYLQFQPDCQYMYDMIKPFDGIYYITGNHADPRMSHPYPCKETLKLAIRDWLAERSDGDDLVFIYISSHGGGYNPTNHTIAASKWELNSDEGEEIRETDVGIDFNGVNGLEDDVWAGVDENIWFEGVEEDPIDEQWNQLYWDDDAKEDLDWLAANGKYGKLVFFSQSCFGGGFIRDLSGENRIIISACNETTPAYGYRENEDSPLVRGYFGRTFIDALNLDGGFDEADVDGDSLLSVLEAYQYAYNHDEARIWGWETPQLDDNGDGVSDSNDGSLASSVYFFQVFTLLVRCSSGGWTFPPPDNYRFKDGTVVLLSAFEDSGYHFVWWAYSTSRISYSWYLEIEMDHDYMAYAYFLPNSGGGGGVWPCPTLFVWNGSDYVDYGVINIHNSTGEDVIREVPIRAKYVDINKNKVLFRLREGWLGLNYSESVIDQVKLYVVDNEAELKLCPLISAEHSSLGKVKSHLLKSDDVKVQMLLLETIDLTFTVPSQNIQGFVFVIEGCNILKM